MNTPDTPGRSWLVCGSCKNKVDSFVLTDAGQLCWDHCLVTLGALLGVVVQVDPEPTTETWEGQPKASEHRTLGERAWCFDCKTYCYRHANCDCCHEAKGWVRLWRRPDGVIVDENGDEEADDE